MSIFMRRFLLILMIPLAALLNGCPKPMAFNLYNNSRDDLVVHYMDGDVQWRRQTVLRLADEELSRVKWIERPDGGGKIPVLDTSNGSLNYRHALIAAYSLPPEFITTRPIMEIHLQMEADGFLYAVNPDGPLPRPIPTPQPSGFPIISIGETNRE